MTIGIYSTKGGVGKTSLSHSLVRDLGYSYKTNDMSTAIEKNNGRMYYKAIPYLDNTLYDFGGFKSKEAEEIAFKLDILLIPVFADPNSILRAMEAVQKFKNQNIYVIPNAIKNQKDLEDIKRIMNHHFPSLNIRYLPVRENRLLPNALKAGLSAIQYVKSTNIGHVYKNSLNDYLKILNIAREFAKNKEETAS